ncbi:spore coat protein GerQ [Mycoplasmatota bacterium zrk1]
MVSYYQYPYVAPQIQQIPTFPQAPITGQGIEQPFFEQSYIENILRLNLGKLATIYMNFENSQWGSKLFKGVLEAAGKDHIIISDPQTGMRYLLLMIYLNYITFEEEINYEYPFEDLLEQVPQQQQQQFQQFQQPPTPQAQPQQPTQQFPYRQDYQGKEKNKNANK